MKPSRYRVSPKGEVHAGNDVTGKGSRKSERTCTSTPSKGGGRGGRSSNAYLAALVEEGGVLAEPVNPKVIVPQHSGLPSRTAPKRTVRNHLRGLDCWRRPYVGLDHASRDFRGYRDLVSYFVREFNVAEGDFAMTKVREHVEEWMEQQLIESVMTVRSLENGQLWDVDRVTAALSADALTTVVMTQYQLVEKVRRILERASRKELQGTVIALEELKEA